MGVFVFPRAIIPRNWSRIHNAPGVSGILFPKLSAYREQDSRYTGKVLPNSCRE